MHSDVQDGRSSRPPGPPFGGRTGREGAAARFDNLLMESSNMPVREIAFTAKMDRESSSSQNTRGIESHAGRF